MVFRREGGELRSDFGQDDLGRAGTDAVHAREVDSGEAPERGSGRLLPAGLEGFLLGRVGVRRHGFLVPFGRLQGLDLPEQPGIVRGNLGGERVEQPQRGRQVEEMLFAPGAGEIAGDLVLRMPTATVTMRGQTDGVTLAPHDGAHHRHAGHAREVGDGAMHLHVHLIQRFLDPLHTARALGHEIGQLALQGAQPGDGLARAERAPQ
jgi:hypothetical protein